MQPIRAYFTQVFWLWVINFAIKPLWVLWLDSKFQAIYGAEAYGSYFSLLGQIYIYSVLLDLGVHSYTTKHLAEGRLQVARHFWQLQSFKAVLSIIYLIVVGLSIAAQNYPSSLKSMLWILAFNQLIFSYLQFFRSILQGMLLYHIDKWLSSIDRLFLVILGSAMIYSGIADSKHIIYFLWLHTLAYALSLGVSIYLVLRTQPLPLASHISLTELIDIVRSALPYSAIVLCMMIYTRIDAIMLSKLMPQGYYHSYIYAYSYRLVDSAFNSLYLLSVFLLPALSDLVAHRSYPTLINKVNISAIIGSTIALIFIALSTLYGLEIFKLLYHIDMPYALSTYRILVWSALGAAWMYVYGTALLAIGRYHTILAIVATACILGVASYYLMIPRYGAIGAAIVASVLQLSVGIAKGVAFYIHIRRIPSSLV